MLKIKFASFLFDALNYAALAMPIAMADLGNASFLTSAETCIHCTKFKRSTCISILIALRRKESPPLASCLR
jgi:hypothetical protein